MTQEAAVRETELPGFLQNKQFFSTKRIFLHSKNFFLQSKINFFSQGKKCQVEGCSCTYCLPDKRMERLVIGICPTQMVKFITDHSFLGTLRYRIPLLKGRFNLNSNEEGEIHLPIRFGENEELKIAAAEI